MNKFEWLRIYNSPFKPPKIHFYIGKIRHGVPYFFPRRWVRNKDGKTQRPVPKKIGFDFVALGWKYKWDEVRHEWNPIWSFVFFKWQIAVYFTFPECNTHYWECWLIYYLHTDKSLSPKERIEQAKEKFPCVWSVRDGEGRKTVCYWDKILKK